MAVKRMTQEERSTATRGALLDAATTLFASRGYAAVSTEEIVRSAGVTRGALYHHFRDKEHLFAAVAEQVEAQLVERIATTAMAQATDPLAALRAGAAAMLDEAVRDDAVRRIVLADAPGVLGWEVWRDILARYGLGLIEATLQAAVDAGQLSPVSVRALAHLLSAALSEGASYVARASDVPQARDEVQAAVDVVIDGLRA